MAAEPNPQNPNRPGALPKDAPPPAPKKTRWLLWGCGILLALVLVIVATIVITLWWIQRPIKPVVLSTQERTLVEQKLRTAGGGIAPAPGANRETKTGAQPPVTAAEAEVTQGQDRPYIPGARVFKLTEREINGLLNANTELGKSVRLEFARDAVNAYVAVPIPADFPLLGGKMFRARGRFDLSLGNGGTPYAILQDVTVFGLSLPKAWLGGLKGENLIGQAMGERNGSPVFKGIKSLRVEPGALVLEVEN